MMTEYFKKPLVFLPVESTLRELDYKLNLSRHFCRAGFEVVIGNPPFIRDELKYKNYRAVFLEKGVNPDPTYYKTLSEKGICLYDLADEGIGLQIYSLDYHLAVNSLKCIRKIFLWGESQLLSLCSRNNSVELQKKYTVIGNPAFDLCTNKFKLFHKELTPKSLPNSYILVNTNFGAVNGHNVEEQLKACSAISPTSYKLMLAGYEREKHQFVIFKSWLEEIIKSFPNETFVIRPHPVEIQKNYEKIFSHYPNVVISKEGNLNQAISSAKIVLHKDCTSALQSYLMGIPVISLGGEELRRYGYEEWTHNFGMNPKSLEEAKARISELLSHKQLDPDTEAKICASAKKTLHSSFANIGNCTKFLIESIIDDARGLLDNFISYELVDNRTSFQKLKVFIRKHLPLYYKVPKAARETLIEYGKHDLEKKLSLFEQVDPLGIELSLKKIFPNTFRISKK